MRYIILIWISFCQALNEHTAKKAALEISLYERSQNGKVLQEKEQKELVLSGYYSPNGPVKSVEGPIFQIHVHVCQRYGNFEEFPSTLGWIGYTKLEPNLLGGCDVYQRAHQAFEHGAMAMIFDVTNSSDDVKRLTRKIDPQGSLQLKGPVIMIAGEEAHTFNRLVILQFLQDFPTFHDYGVTKEAFARIRVPENETHPVTSAEDHAIILVAIGGLVSLVVVVVSVILIVYKLRCVQRSAECTVEEYTKKLLRDMKTRHYQCEKKGSPPGINSGSVKGSRFPVRSASVASGFSLDSMADSCAICLSTYKHDEELRVLQCLHEFHKSCVDPWLVKNRTCPLCLYNILERDCFQSRFPAGRQSSHSAPSSLPASHRSPTGNHGNRRSSVPSNRYAQDYQYEAVNMNAANVIHNNNANLQYAYRQNRALNSDVLPGNQGVYQQHSNAFEARYREGYRTNENEARTFQYSSFYPPPYSGGQQMYYPIAHKDSIYGFPSNRYLSNQPVSPRRSLLCDSSRSNSCTLNPIGASSGPANTNPQILKHSCSIYSSNLVSQPSGAHVMSPGAVKESVSAPRSKRLARRTVSNHRPIRGGDLRLSLSSESDADLIAHSLRSSLATHSSRPHARPLPGLRNHTDADVSGDTTSSAEPDSDTCAARDSGKTGNVGAGNNISGINETGSAYPGSSKTGNGIQGNSKTGIPGNSHAGSMILGNFDTGNGLCDNCIGHTSNESMYGSSRGPTDVSSSSQEESGSSNELTRPISLAIDNPSASVPLVPKCLLRLSVDGNTPYPSAFKPVIPRRSKHSPLTPYTPLLQIAPQPSVVDPIAKVHNLNCSRLGNKEPEIRSLAATFYDLTKHMPPPERTKHCANNTTQTSTPNTYDRNRDKRNSVLNMEGSHKNMLPQSQVNKSNKSEISSTMKTKDSLILNVPTGSRSTNIGNNHKTNFTNGGQYNLASFHAPTSGGSKSNQCSVAPVNNLPPNSSRSNINDLWARHALLTSRLQSLLSYTDSSENSLSSIETIVTSPAVSDCHGDTLASSASKSITYRAGVCKRRDATTDNKTRTAEPFCRCPQCIQNHLHSYLRGETNANVFAEVCGYNAAPVLTNKMADYRCSLPRSLKEKRYASIRSRFSRFRGVGWPMVRPGSQCLDPASLLCTHTLENEVNLHAFGEESANETDSLLSHHDIAESQMVKSFSADNAKYLAQAQRPAVYGLRSDRKRVFARSKPGDWNPSASPSDNKASNLNKAPLSTSYTEPSEFTRNQGQFLGQKTQKNKSILQSFSANSNLNMAAKSSAFCHYGYEPEQSAISSGRYEPNTTSAGLNNYSNGENSSLDIRKREINSPDAPPIPPRRKAVTHASTRYRPVPVPMSTSGLTQNNQSVPEHHLPPSTQQSSSYTSSEGADIARGLQRESSSYVLHGYITAQLSRKDEQASNIPKASMVIFSDEGFVTVPIKPTDCPAAL